MLDSWRRAAACVALADCRAPCPRQTMGKEEDDSLLSSAGNDDASQAARALDAGADIEAYDGDGCSALILAAKNSCYNVLEFLLERNAKVNAMSTVSPSKARLSFRGLLIRGLLTLARPWRAEPADAAAGHVPPRGAVRGDRRQADREWR